MQHLKIGRSLRRSKGHRLALFRNLASSLIEHEAITTTVAKAKEARRFIERLITLARRATPASRRLVASRLANEAMAKKLVEDVAKRFADRPGGYTRVIKLAKYRIGDATQLARLELVVKKEKPKPEKKGKGAKKEAAGKK
jgi:large subunit ribosomal protein L17